MGVWVEIEEMNEMEGLPEEATTQDVQTHFQSDEYAEYLGEAAQVIKEHTFVMSDVRDAYYKASELASMSDLTLLDRCIGRETSKQSTAAS